MDGVQSLPILFTPTNGYRVTAERLLSILRLAIDGAWESPTDLIAVRPNRGNFRVSRVAG